MAGERRRRRLRRVGRQPAARPTDTPAADTPPARAEPLAGPASAAAPARAAVPAAGDDAAAREPHRPSPADLADLPGPFALTVGVADADVEDGHHEHRVDDALTERGLRGLVGSGSSQVGVGAAMRARDASRASQAHEAQARESLTIVRRGWVPREDLPRPGGPRR